MIEQAELNRAFFARYGEPSWAFWKAWRAEPSFGSDPTLVISMTLPRNLSKKHCGESRSSGRWSARPVPFSFFTTNWMMWFQDITRSFCRLMLKTDNWKVSSFHASPRQFQVRHIQQEKMIYSSLLGRNRNSKYGEGRDRLECTKVLCFSFNIQK